jgi:hypothetical protein
VSWLRDDQSGGRPTQTPPMSKRSTLGGGDDIAKRESIVFFTGVVLKLHAGKMVAY